MPTLAYLTEPVDGTDYSEKTVVRLFAHDAMQEEVGSLDPLNAAVGTGALGRMADVLQLNGFRTSRIAVESTTLPALQVVCRHGL